MLGIWLVLHIQKCNIYIFIRVPRVAGLVRHIDKENNRHRGHGNSNINGISKSTDLHSIPQQRGRQPRSAIHSFGISWSGFAPESAQPPPSWHASCQRPWMCGTFNEPHHKSLGIFTMQRPKLYFSQKKLEKLPARGWVIAYLPPGCCCCCFSQVQSPESCFLFWPLCIGVCVCVFRCPSQIHS